MRVPGEPRKFLMKQHELLYTEVTASNLVKVDDGRRPRREVGRQPAGLHAARRRARGARRTSIARCTSTPRPAWRFAGLKHGLRMVSQQAIRFYQRIGYHAYEGITEDFGERARINRDLGKNRALIMHNHGLLTVGKTAREAFVLMKSSDRRGRHPAEDGSDRRRADRDPAGRSAKRPPRNTSITTSAAARPTGRPICACSTRSTRATATDRARRKAITS